ncbi:hypothetical protein D3C79_707640 [compost metagenome]
MTGPLRQPIQSIGVQYQRPVGPDQPLVLGASPLVLTEPGPHHLHLGPVLIDPGLSAHQLRLYQADGAMARVLAQPHQTGPRPQAGQPRQQYGPLHAQVAPHQQDPAVATLVRRAWARGQQGLEGGVIDPLGGGDKAGIRRHPEAVAVELADAVHPVGGQHALLDADEAEGASGAHQGAHGATGVGVEPGGQVHRQYGGIQAIDCCDDLCHGRGEGDMDTGAEQCIYHQIRWRQRREFELVDQLHAAPSGQPLIGGPPGIPRQQAGGPRGDHQGLETDPSGEARQHIAVAAIVAGADEDPPVAALGPVVAGVAEQGRAGPRHQLIGVAPFAPGPALLQRADLFGPPQRLC